MSLTAFKAGLLLAAALLASCGGSASTPAPAPPPIPPVPAPVFTVSTIIGPAPGEPVPANPPLQRGSGLAVDASGLMYVSDSGNAIFTLTQAGVLTKLANSYDAGALVRDAAGNLLAGASTRIEKISPEGVVSFYAGVRFGYKDGPVDVAELRAVKGLVYDPAGTLFITDNKTVRRIAPDRTVFTLAGRCDPIGSHAGDTICASGPSKDGAGDEARFTNPNGIAYFNGALYVNDVNAIRKVALDGQVTTIARIEGASLAGIAVAPDGTIYVADPLNFNIRRVTPSGHVSTVAEKIGQAQAPGNYLMELRLPAPDTLLVVTNNSVYKITIK